MKLNDPRPSSHDSIEGGKTIGSKKVVAHRYHSTARDFFLDLLWLFGIQTTILAMLALTSATSSFAAFDAGDLRISLAMTVFLLPGWWLAPRVCPTGSGLDTRYVIAAVISFIVHTWIAWPSSRLGLSFNFYYVTFSMVSLVAALDRLKQIRATGCPVYRIRWPQVCLCLAMLFFICAAFRIPHSNDIAQFLMQQIDMAAERNLSPSAIGMTALGIDRPMPRWNTNAYHVWFSLLADVTRLPVEGIVKRWATVPMAVISLLTFCWFVKQYLIKRTPDWVVVLAVMGPVTIWFRNYSAYVYAMRVTNNFCLDKDFALFWLIPAWLWFLHRAIRVNQRSAWIMLGLMTPLCITIHPMTAIYLCMLYPFAIAIAAPINRQGFFRSVIAGALPLSMFLYVFASGGAQAFHNEIETIIQHDVATTTVTGQDRHHWSGHYAAVPNIDTQLDTTQWRDGTLQLRPQLLWTGSSLVSLFLATCVSSAILFLDPKLRTQWRWLAACGIAAAILLLLFAASGFALTTRPHLYRGIERLHWFAFLPAAIAIAFCLNTINSQLQKRVSARAISIAALLCLIMHLTEQGWHIARAQPTLLNHTPILHSVFDFYAPNQPAKSLAQLERFSIGDGPLPPKPTYLRRSDHVLLLSSQESTAYWELRQAVWWPELYGEANALAVYGDDFLADWQAYYDAFDGLANANVLRWINEKDVTLIVDSRAGADRFVTQLAGRINRPVKKERDGVWRLLPIQVIQ